MLRVLNRESVERQGRGAHEVTRRIWRFKTSWLALRGHLLAVSKTAKGKPPPGSPETASPNCKAVEDVLPSSLPFTAVCCDKFGEYSTLGSPDGPRGAGGGGAPVCFAQWAHNRRR